MTYIPSSITGVLHSAGSETITGAKTFSTGTILDKGSLFFDVKAYGATGDGTTNDASAISSAYTAAKAANGVLYFPPGTYIVNSPLTINGSGLTILGAGRGQSTLKAGATLGAGNGVFTLLPATGQTLQNIKFSGLTFDINNQANTQGITLKGGTYTNGDNVQYVTIESCEFKNLAMVDAGMIMFYSGRGATDRGPIRNVTIRDCQFYATAKFHIYVNGGQVENLLVDHCVFRDSQGGCIAWNSSTKTSQTLASYRSNRNWTVSNCYFTNNGLAGSALAGALNAIHDSARAGIRNLKIANNFFDGYVTTDEQYCINVHAVWGLEIFDNTFWKTRTIMAIGASENGDWWKTIPDAFTKIRGNLFYQPYNIHDHDSVVSAIWESNIFYEVQSSSLATGTSRHRPSQYINNLIYNCNAIGVSAASGKAALGTSPDGLVIRGNTIIDDRLLINPTTAAVLSAITSGSGHGARTYYIKYTYVNDTGETLASSESSLALTDTQLLKAEIPYSSTYGVPSGAKKVNWYASITTGTETLQDYTPTAWTTEIETDHVIAARNSWTEPSSGLISGTALPTVNTTQPRSIFGFYELSTASGQNHLLPSHFTDNILQGIPVPFWKDSDVHRATRNNFINGGLTNIRSTTDGAMTSGSTTLTSSTAAFTAADVGKTVIVLGFGTSTDTLYTTISSYTSATQVTLSKATATTYSGAVLIIGTAMDFTRDSERLMEAEPYQQGNITGATTFDVGNSEVIFATITGNVTATLLDGHYIGQRLERRFTMGGSGSYTYTKASNEILKSSVYTPSSAVGNVDVLIQRWDGTNWVELSRSLGAGITTIAEGGTGATTQTTAFNALAPTTTKGDLVVHNGTNNIRVGIGTNNQVLTADSTQASGLKWGAAGSSSPGGSNTQVQFNDSSAFGGDASLTFNKTTNALSAGSFIATTNTGAITSLVGYDSTALSDSSLVATTTTHISIANALGTYGTQYGIDIGALTTGSTTDIGIRVAKADTYTLQLSDTGGTAAGGITFGTDTNLYRSAANTLKTDDSLNVTGSLTLGTVLSVANGGTGTAILTGLVKGNGTGAFTVATSGTDYAPAGVVTLTDATTIATDASLGTEFRVTLGGSRTMGNPTNAVDGQRILYRVKQPASGGPWTITWGSNFRFGADLPQPVLTTTAAKQDYIAFVYNGTDTKFDCIGVSRGY